MQKNVTKMWNKKTKLNSAEIFFSVGRTLDAIIHDLACRVLNEHQSRSTKNVSVQFSFSFFKWFDKTKNKQRKHGL